MAGTRGTRVLSVLEAAMNSRARELPSFLAIGFEASALNVMQSLRSGELPEPWVLQYGNGGGAYAVVGGVAGRKQAAGASMTRTRPVASRAA